MIQSIRIKLMTIQTRLEDLSEEQKNNGKTALSLVLSDLGEKVNRLLGEILEHDESIRFDSEK